MTRYPGLGYKRMDENVLHVYTECPEGRIIPIAKRDTVSMNSPGAMKGLEWCAWCFEKAGRENRSPYGSVQSLGTNPFL
jgi:hypothetical protein